MDKKSLKEDVLKNREISRLYADAVRAEIKRIKKKRRNDGKKGKN